MPIPFVTVTLDKPRRLRLSMGAMVEFEQLTGTNIMDVEADMSLTVLAQLLWVMLKQDEKDLTLEQACALIDDGESSLLDIIQAVTKAMTEAFDTGETKNAKPAARKK